ncbi:MAG: transcription antitermination factor NusB [Bacilli bacterium]|nr:transcription antitermination factor NusB [Bacilli bacterium]
MTRSDKREVIIKIIYQTLILDKIDDKYDLNSIIKEYDTEDKFIVDTVKNVKDKEKELVELGNKYLNDKWSMNRLPVIDQAIIMLSIYELLYTDTPNVVIINEAIELSKKYSDEAMPKVINGVLDSVFHNEERVNE